MVNSRFHGDGTEVKVSKRAADAIPPWNRNGGRFVSLL